MIRLLAVVFLLVWCGTAYGQGGSFADAQYRLTGSVAHPVAGRLFGNGSVAIEEDRDTGERSYRLAWPSAIFKQNSWLAEWGGVTDVWSTDDDGSTSWQVRPFVGMELSSPRSNRVRVINLTRLEWLHTIRGNDDDDRQRLRNRVDVEFPLTGRGWTPRAYYGVAEAEPLINVRDGFLEAFRIGGTAGSALNDRVRLEAQCLGEWSRKANTRLSYRDTLVRVYLKFSFKRGLFETIGGSDPGS